MTKMKSRAVALALGCLAPHAANATSGISSIWVSGTGADSAGCGPAANPCRTFQYAHDIVDPNGEIRVRDSGGYQKLVITKSIAIINDGAGVAGVSAISNAENAITVAAGPTDRVLIKGLTINGGGQGGGGIVASSFGNLTVTDCVVTGFGSSAGIAITSSASVTFTISDSVITGNAVGFSFSPTSMTPPSPPAKGLLLRVDLSGNNTNLSINAPTTTGLFVRDSNLSNAQTASISGAGQIYLSRSIVANSPTGVSITGQFNTYGDNIIRGNTTNITGTPTNATLK
jgi:hypothetical protein